MNIIQRGKNFFGIVLNKRNDAFVESYHTHHTEVTFKTTQENINKFKMFNFSEGVSCMKLFIQNKMACYRIDYNDEINRKKISTLIKNLDDSAMVIYY